MDQFIELAELHQSLHDKWLPHIGQIPVGKAVFFDRVKKIFVCAGRSFGKSQLAAYLVTRIALENPGSTNYIFAPFIGQAKEIYWTPRLIHKLLDPDDIASDNSTEMRIILNKDSTLLIVKNTLQYSFKLYFN